MTAVEDDYEVVPYRPEFKRQVAALQQHLWRGGMRRNVAFLEWKYERNPYLSDPLIYLALHDGRVVGMRGMFGSSWEAGPSSERFVVPCADDLVIAPRHRNQGLLGRIMRAAFADLERRGYPVSFSLSAAAVTMASSLADGWRGVGSVRALVRVASPGSWRWRLGTRMLRWRMIWRWARLVSHGRRPFRHLDDQIRHPAAGRAITVTRDPQPDAMADLVRRLGHDGRVRHVRDPEYLAWRFKNPQREYRFLWAGGDQLEGYIVLAAGWEGVQSRINIVDWEGTDRQTRLALLRAAIAGGRFAEMDAWSLGLSEESSSMLRDAGFAPVSRRRLVRDGPVVLVRPVVRPPPPGGPRLGPLALLDQPNWDMRMLYSMSG